MVIGGDGLTTMMNMNFDVTIELTRKIELTSMGDNGNDGNDDDSDMNKQK